MVVLLASLIGVAWANDEEDLPEDLVLERGVVPVEVEAEPGWWWTPGWPTPRTCRPRWP